ncbi:MAG: hypothetical protein ABI411_10415 [Tahibacter sp.]
MGDQISLSRIRELNLLAAFAPGRPPFLSAASGLVAVGNHLYVVADDEHLLGVFPRFGDAAGTGIRLLPGDLPLDPKSRKKQKPDFETLTQLPAFDGYPGGALLAFGSGSRTSRSRGALLGLDACGGVVGETCPVDLAPLYAELGQRLHGLNVEGAAVVNDQLWLFQRGNSRDASSACIRLSLPQVLAALSTGLPLSGEMLAGISPVTLGDVDGVPLGFTDATCLSQGQIIFCAVAEDVDNAYSDGKCMGASIGLLDQDARVQWIRRLETTCKVEGIAATIDGDGWRILLVTDADDPSIPAQLLTAPFRADGSPC